MEPGFFTSLLLALTFGNAAASGHGFFEQILGDPNQVTWDIGGITSAGALSTGIGPVPCFGTCTFDFSATAQNLPVAIIPGYTIFAAFSFYGPATTAVATCVGLTCDGRGYATTWGPVPITMTGRLRWFNNARPSEFEDIFIAGSGIAQAFNRYELPVGPWNYSQTRYEFDYARVPAIVPEPVGGALVASGIGFVAVVLITRRRRGIAGA